MTTLQRTGRIRLGLLSGKTWEAARAVVDESLRSFRDVLSAFRWREQVPFVVDCIIDTAALPLRLEVRGMKAAPVTVLLLSARVQRGDGETISGGALTWAFRAGKVEIFDAPSLAASTRYDAVIAVME